MPARVKAKPLESVFCYIVISARLDKWISQTFCREVVLWKHLSHPNIVSVLGATITPSQLISDWMSGGDLPENVKNPSVDRLGLVGATPIIFIPH